jgi:hypothetical protein
MTYSQQIGKATSHDELKVIGAKLFNSKISKEKRVDLVKLYRERRRELDRSMVDASTNKTLKRILYNINTLSQTSLQGVAAIGKEIYDITKSGILNRHEADLAFRAYRHQKRKAGVEFKKPEAQAA